jgi:leucyl-tRNA synthetase
MSKSLGNVVRPDSLVIKYGADTTRTYVMFIGPHDQAIAWDENGIQGVWRFLNKVWENMLKDDGETDENIYSKTQLLIKSISDDIENFKMNTAVAKLMEFNNLMQLQKTISKEIKRDYLKLLYPFAPHMCEELNEIINEDQIYKSKWPKFDKTKLREDTVIVIIQINGKKRAMIKSKKGLSEDQLLEEVKKIDRISEELNKDVKKIIYVQDKILNIVK